MPSDKFGSAESFCEVHMHSLSRKCSIALVITLAWLSAVEMGGAQSGPNRATRPQLAPYTAEFKITSVRTLANGATITRVSDSVEARDSQGRFFHKQEMDPGVESRIPRNSIGSIRDPIEGTNTNWQSITHETVVTKLPAPDQRHGCWANDAGVNIVVYDPPSNPPKASAMPIQPPQIEDLGTAMIEGIEVHGRRFTRTIPAGQIGNDQPIVSTNETWSAPSLGGLTLKSIDDDPRNGKTTREVVQLEPGEPDPALFQAPPDYQVRIQELHQASCDQSRR